MNIIVKLLLCLLVAFFIALVLSPILIAVIKKEKVKQVILHYVESHKSKSGTPTMGGIIFITTIIITSCIFINKQNCTLAVMSLVVMFSYGIVGFLDDFIKFKFRRNLGLRAYQKIIFQLAISIIISVFAYKNVLLGGSIILPFSGKIVDIGVWVIPLNVLVLIATTNSVNLTDGLDGLAAGTSLSYVFSYILLIFAIMLSAFAGINGAELIETGNILIIAAACVGALICYLLFNCFPAKIFMGDTGSLALGALIASLMIFTKTTLYLPMIGIMFVLSSVSVIMQVAYYKLTKKRIFLMAPLHHHYEKKGVHEVRITTIYSFVTLLVGIGVVLLEIL